MRLRLSDRLAAEFFGTFLFVFVGAGSAVATKGLGISDPAASLIIAALANGMGLAVAVSATMNISGGSLNPAATLALWIARKIPRHDVIPYMVVELSGATLSGLVLMVSLPSIFGVQASWGAPSLGPGMGVLQGIILELFMTVFLLFAVFGTAVYSRAPKVAGFGIGFAVLADTLLGGSFTGAAMNPARAFGPMLASLSFPGYWYVYLVGPFAGALLAGFFYGTYLSGDDHPKAEINTADGRSARN